MVRVLLADDNARFRSLLRRLLERTGAYRYVWHRALFDLALYVVLLGAVVLLVM